MVIMVLGLVVRRAGRANAGVLRQDHWLAALPVIARQWCSADPGGWHPWAGWVDEFDTDGDGAWSSGARRVGP
jgi:hypothetical protein